MPRKIVEISPGYYSISYSKEDEDHFDLLKDRLSLGPGRRASADYRGGRRYPKTCRRSRDGRLSKADQALLKRVQSESRKSIKGISTSKLARCVNACKSKFAGERMSAKRAGRLSQ